MNSEIEIENQNDIKIPKKRGRKKKVVPENEINESISELDNNGTGTGTGTETGTETGTGTETENGTGTGKGNGTVMDTVKKKRGRKKKWEVETTTKFVQNSPITFSENDNKNIKSDQVLDNYDEKQILFGSLNIKIHTNKDSTNNIENIKETLKNNTKNKNKCRINLTTSDFEDSDTETTTNKLKSSKKIIEKNIKVMKFFKDSFDTGNEILMSKHRCYHCSYTFPNKPFFLPIDYSPELNRYRVTGNFCSPNCVKAYAFNSKLYCNKVHLVSLMYRKLFGQDTIIKPAPPIQCLKDYGGTMSIEDFRLSFNTKTEYKLKHICSKIMYDEVMVN